MGMEVQHPSCQGYPCPGVALAGSRGEVLRTLQGGRPPAERLGLPALSPPECCMSTDCSSYRQPRRPQLPRVLFVDRFQQLSSSSDQCCLQQLLLLSKHTGSCPIERHHNVLLLHSKSTICQQVSLAQVSEQMREVTLISFDQEWEAKVWVKLQLPAVL